LPRSHTELIVGRPQVLILPAPAVPPHYTGLRSTLEDAVLPVLPSAEPASDTQQPAGGGKKEKERQRKERQRQRKMDEAWEALQAAMEAMLAGARCVSPLWLMCIGRIPGEVVVSSRSWQGALTCGGACGCSGASALGAVEKATAEAEKHGDRSEKLSALVAEARGMIEQAKTEQAERARLAAEEMAAAAAVEAAAAAEASERLQVEEQMAAITLRMQNDALTLQQMRASVGGSVLPPAAPAPHQGTEETMCVVCFDAPKDHIMVPCGHQCVRGVCAELLTTTRTSTCPVCHEPIQQTMKVFCS
jgi:hypothetical protein